jgi:hypothetical protein
VPFLQEVQQLENIQQRQLLTSPLPLYKEGQD